MDDKGNAQDISHPTQANSSPFIIGALAVVLVIVGMCIGGLADRLEPAGISTLPTAHRPIPKRS